jgi:hypothetical protein
MISSIPVAVRCEEEGLIGGSGRLAGFSNFDILNYYRGSGITANGQAYHFLAANGMLSGRQVDLSVERIDRRSGAHDPCLIYIRYERLSLTYNHTFYDDRLAGRSGRVLVLPVSDCGEKGWRSLNCRAENAPSRGDEGNRDHYLLSGRPAAQPGADRSP